MLECTQDGAFSSSERRPYRRNVCVTSESSFFFGISGFSRSRFLNEASGVWFSGKCCRTPSFNRCKDVPANLSLIPYLDELKYHFNTLITGAT